MPARDMTSYMRARRARQKAEREAAEPVVDAALPRDAIMKASDRELKPITGYRSIEQPSSITTNSIIRNWITLRYPAGIMPLHVHA
jgi:hypothetical protein